MAITEVRKLVEKFELNMDKITSLHRLITVNERKYREFWSGIWKECEATGHDAKITANRASNKCGSQSHFCHYCGKKLCQGHSFWEDSFPQKIYRLDYIKNWLMTKPEEWPEEKRELLAKIKEGIGEYLNMAEPLQDKMRELADDQIATRSQLNEIYALCESVLHNTQKSSGKN